ncbi:LIPID TRANSFER PROTEIN [Salix purpurea]|uniref:LIPID TRANSFER PROTEIN n=1 Tax=Salix purpurea TaxID=77065 RepID=A0A9Q0SWF4_SALPP|nr:LIPID TRANSFER PROTEIN [Salix purpurea]
MAAANTHRHALALSLFLIVGVHILGNHKVSANCKEIVPSLVSNCSRFVRVPGPKVPPSAACCKVAQAVTVADVPCFCKLITPAVQKVISMEKVVYVARTCGLPVPPGTVCGSYTVPPKFV